MIIFCEYLGMKPGMKKNLFVIVMLFEGVIKIIMFQRSPRTRLLIRRRPPTRSSPMIL